MPKRRIYTPDTLRKHMASKKWVMPYNRLTAVVDHKTNKVLYIEEYGPANGIFVEGWRAIHYPLTSPLVERTYREGSQTIVVLRQGRSALTIKPSFSPFGISSCRVSDSDVKIGFEGVGGAGVSAAYSRGMAKGVVEVAVLQPGGGGQHGKSEVVIYKSKMLLMGIDDTDNETVGATYALVDSIAKEAEEKFGVRYFVHVNVQLYPYNPHKTKNCFSTVIGFVYADEEARVELISYFIDQLKQHTVSDQTAMAVFDGFTMSDTFIDYCRSLKFRMATDLLELKNLAQAEGVECFEITGERGLFGAIGALGFWDMPDYAAKLPSQCV